MKIDDIRNAAVIGAGTMGHGIAEQLAILGINVRVRDVSPEILKGARERIEWSLGKLYKRGAIREEPAKVLDRIYFTTSLEEALTGVELVVEAVPERLELKREVFSAAAAYARTDALLATNTGSIPITEIAEALPEGRRPNAIGLHFFNPVVLMPIVEVVRGRYTSEEALGLGVELVRRMGKTPVVVRKDVPGFISNRMSVRYIGAAVRLVEWGLATPAEVDAALRYRLGLPMGVFEMVDFSGLDVFYFYFEETIKRGLREEIPETLRRMFEGGTLGMKSGRGFYTYPAPGVYVRVSLPRSAAHKVDVLSVLAPMINEGAFLIREGVASAADIDTIMKLGFGFPLGVLEYGDVFGLDAVKSSLEALARRRDFYAPDPLIGSMVAEGRLGVKSGRGFYEYGDVREERMRGVVVRVEGQVGWVVLNRPEVLNAMDMEMMGEVERAIDVLERDPGVRVIVIMGAGRAFSAGADVSMLAKFTPSDAYAFSKREHRMVERVERCGKPTICAIGGYALGGGLELAMGCDIRVAAEDARLGLPEANLGIMPGGGGTQRLVRLVGLGRALWMMMLGEHLSALDAQQYGLVNLVVQPSTLEGEARLLARRLAAMPPMALRSIKAAARAAADAPLERGLEVEAAHFSSLFATRDAREGISAFLEKRRPTFRGE